MQPSPACYVLICSFEHCYLHAYLDQGGVPTIGWGHISGVHMGDTCTQAQADAWLTEEIVYNSTFVERYNSTYNWTQSEFDALTSFAYNCGGGRIKDLTANGTRSKPQIAEAILQYNKVRDRRTGAIVVSRGLVRRRTAERTLFLNNPLPQDIVDGAPPETPHKQEYITGGGESNYFYPQKPVYNKPPKRSPLIYYLKAPWRRRR